MKAINTATLVTVRQNKMCLISAPIYEGATPAQHKLHPDSEGKLTFDVLGSDRLKEKQWSG